MELYGGIIRCSSCNKELNPPYDKVYRKGKTVHCEKCEREKKIKNSSPLIEEDEEDKICLYNTIRKLFSINSIPEWWIAQIDRFHKEGKSYLALEYTLRYAILYQGFTPQEEYGLSGIVSMYYEEAARNYTKEEEVRSVNEQTKIKEEERVVSIKMPRATSWKPTSKIEDL